MDMNLRMTLTLADAASGPLRAFVGLMEQVNALARAGAPRLEAFAAGITNIGRAASASGVVQAFNASLVSAAGAMERVQAVSGGAATGIGTVAERAVAATASVSGLTAATTANTAAAEASAAGHARAGQRIGTVNTQAGSLMDTLKGLAAVWAAFKVEKFLIGSVKEAGQFSLQEASLRSLNLGAEKTNEILGKAWDNSRALGFVSVLDSIKGRMAAIGGLAQTMDQSVIDATLPRALTLANNLKMMGEKGSLEDMVRNVYGFVEARGQTHDPAAINRSFDFIQKSFTGTGGKLDLKDWEMLMRRLGQGASQISDEGLFNLVGALDQMKISGSAGGSGGGASQLGVAVKMLQAYGLGKPMNKQGAALFADAGIIDPAALIPSGASSLRQNVKPGGFRDGDLLASDPFSWLQKMMPLIMDFMRKHAKTFYQGTDPNDPNAQAVALQKFITTTGMSVTAAQALGIMGQPATATRIREQSEISQHASGVQGTKQQLDDTWPQKVQNLSAAFDNLQKVIGDRLLPVIGPVIDGLTRLINSFAQFSADHPALTFFNTLAIVVGTVAAGFYGLRSVFGIVGSLTGLIGGVGTAATATGVAVEAGFFARLISGFGLIPKLGAAFGVFAADVVAGAAMVGRAFLRMLPLVGALLLAWDLGALLLQFEVFGHSLGDWALHVMDPVINAFKNGWIRTKEILGLMTADAAKAARDANNIGLAARDKEFGSRRPLPDGVTPGTAGAGRGIVNPAEVKPVQARDGIVDDLWGGRGSKGSAGRFAHYDAELDAAKNAYRLAEDADKRAAEAQARLFKANKISVDAYYTEKLAMLTASVNGEILILEREKAAFDRIGDKAGSGRMATDITIKQRSLGSGADAIEADRKEAMLKLDKEAADVQRDLLKTSGQRKTAEAQRLIDENRLKMDALVLNQAITREDADAYLAQMKAAVELRQMEADQQIRGEAYRAQLIAIDAAERNGTITELDATRQKIALRKQEAAAADVLLSKELALAVASKDFEGAAKIRTALAQNNATLGELPPEMTTVLKSAEQGFTTFFSSILNGTKSVKGAFGSLVLSIGQTINDLIAKQLGTALFKSLFGDTGGGGGGLMQSLGGGIGSWLSGLFGGGGGAGGSGFQGLLSWFTSLFGFESGGYTGGRDTRSVAGVVHGGEFVFSAPAVRSIGTDVLERAHQAARRGAPASGLGGYADGGLAPVLEATDVESSPMSSASSVALLRAIEMNTRQTAEGVKPLAVMSAVALAGASSGGGGGGGGGAGAGAVGGRIGSWLSGLFGGGGGGAGAIGNMGAGFVVPGFAVGTDYVPRDMLAMVHEGERITPKAFNPATGGRAGPAVINQTINISAPGGIDRSTAGQLAARMARAARTESTRGTAG